MLPSTKHVFSFSPDFLILKFRKTNCIPLSKKLQMHGCSQTACRGGPGDTSPRKGLATWDSSLGLSGSSVIWHVPTRVLSHADPHGYYEQCCSFWTNNPEAFRQTGRHSPGTPRPDKRLGGNQKETRLQAPHWIGKCLCSFQTVWSEMRSKCELELLVTTDWCVPLLVGCGSKEELLLFHLLLKKKNSKTVQHAMFAGTQKGKHRYKN